MPAKPCIFVLAGTNGAGKSSVAGAAFRAAGTEYFNPDEVAARIRERHPSVTLENANSAAWAQGKRLLERAIRERNLFAFETTLGGATISALLEEAVDAGFEVRIWYVGLANPEKHMSRVQARVASGGHPISEEKIRERFDRSRKNLIRLMPKLTELVVYDNSRDADFARGERPKPELVLHMRGQKIESMAEDNLVADWAKPIVAVALRMAAKRGGSSRRPR